MAWHRDHGCGGSFRARNHRVAIVKINNPSVGNVIATTNPLSINIGNAAVAGVLGEVSDSGHQHGVAVAQFMRLAGEQLTEGTTTSTSAVDLITLTGLSIPVDTPFLIVCSFRKTAGVANQIALGLTLNATVVTEAAVAAGVLYRSGAANAAESGAVCIYVGPRTALYLRAAARFFGGASGSQDFWLVDEADMPTVAITDVIIRGLTASALNTLGADDLRVYLLPTA